MSLHVQPNPTLYPKPTVGQFVCVVESRHSRPDLVTLPKVDKVGRKYFTIGHQEFHLSNWRVKSEYSAGVCAYPDEATYQREVERVARIRRIEVIIRNNWTLNQLGTTSLQTIEAILNTVTK